MAILPQAEVEDWIKKTVGWFSNTDINREFNISTRQGMSARRVIIHRLVESMVIEKHLTKEGLYRLIQTHSELNFKNTEPYDFFQIKMPFNLENYVLFYPKNIAVIAGSSNSGKTAFLLNVIKLNMSNHDIWYFTSELGVEELRLRLDKFDIPIEAWNFHAVECSHNFQDVIRPNGLNIIDYLEFGEGVEFFQVADVFRHIVDKLENGICWIALQKKKKAELGRGAEFSLEKPRLYLSLDYGKIIIIKAKNWAIEGENPNGLSWKFKLINGCDFINIEQVIKNE